MTERSPSESRTEPDEVAEPAAATDPRGVTRTGNKRLELGARSRDEILNAALRTMALYGYDGTSISRIAAESGLPSSSIYWHFSSKAGVLAAVMERGADRFFSSDTVERPAEADPREVFRLEMLAAGLSAEHNPEFLRLLFLLVLSGGPDDDVTRHVRAVVERGKTRLRRGIEDAFAEHGAVRAAAVADATVDYAQGVFDGVFITVQTHPGVRYADLMAQVVTGVLAVADHALTALD